jgi:thiopeptide-type bacteriocin biosynthesis protein
MIDIKQRDFFIGSKWVYYKIYIGPSESNLFLLKLENIIKEMLEAEIIESFFFIRYYDPEFHLRLRFQLKNVGKVGQVISYLYDLFGMYYNELKIHKIQIDTYKQEVERYGVETIEISEKLFFNDSLLILNLLKEEVNDYDMWFKMFKVCDLYLDLFGYSLKDKYLLTKQLSLGFEKEFAFDKAGKKALAAKYRQNRFKIEGFMITDNLSLNALMYKSGPLVDEIFNRVHFNKNRIKELLISYLHMSINRAFSSSARLNEYVIYDFLSMFYKSKIAINSSNKSKL